MTKWYRENAPITAEKLTDELMRLKRGSVTRRHFLGVTGLGLATAVLARQPGLFSSPAYAQDLGTTDVARDLAELSRSGNLRSLYGGKTGVAVEVNVFGSNEEMLAKLQAGGIGWDLFVPTNYTISTYAEARPDRRSSTCRKLPNFSQATQNAALHRGRHDRRQRPMPCRRTGARPAWRSTPSKIKTKITSWKDFFEVAMSEADGRAMVHDYQLTTIGSALVSLGYSLQFDQAGRACQGRGTADQGQAASLRASISDYQPGMRATDAWMTMCWTNDGAQLNRDMPEIAYMLGTDGGEIWCDFYAIPKSAANKPAGYALLELSDGRRQTPSRSTSPTARRPPTAACSRCCRRT